MMGKLWTRVKYRYLKSIPKVPKGLVVLVVTGLLYLLYVLLHVTSDSGDIDTDDVIKGGAKPVRTHMSQPEIDSYLKAMLNTSPSSCINNLHNDLDKLMAVPVSIILHYRGAEFYALKLALASLARNTPSELLREVIIIEDGVAASHIQQQVETFLSQELFEGVGIKRYRSTEPQGCIHSRHKGSLLAKGRILVFANSEVVFNKGWIEPLIKYLVDNPKTIAVPHMDSVLDGYRFMEVDSDLVTMSTWGMSILHHKVKGGVHGNTMSLPVMSGQMFGINKKFYESLGEYDTEFIQDKAADLELSLRAWLCGGKVIKLLCSRVAVWDVMSPVKIQLMKDVKRITNLWLEDQYGSIVHSLVNIPAGTKMSDAENKLIRSRKHRLMYDLYNTCHDFKWYLQNVATALEIPSSNFVTFGKLRSAVGKCLTWQGSPPKNAINVVHCTIPIYEPNSVFEYTSDNRITVGGSCLVADNTHSIRVVECEVTAGSHKVKWSLTKQGHLRNEAFNMCLDQIGQDKVMLAPCTESDRQKWAFIK